MSDPAQPAVLARTVLNNMRNEDVGSDAGSTGYTHTGS